MENRYEVLKDVEVNINDLIKHLRLAKDGLYDTLFKFHMKRHNVESRTVEIIILITGWGTRDISFSKKLYDLAQENNKQTV